MRLSKSFSTFQYKKILLHTDFLYPHFILFFPIAFISTLYFYCLFIVELSFIDLARVFCSFLTNYCGKRGGGHCLATWVICSTGIGFSLSRTTCLDLGKGWFLERHHALLLEEGKKKCRTGKKNRGRNPYSECLFNKHYTCIISFNLHHNWQSWF